MNISIILFFGTFIFTIFFAFTTKPSAAFVLYEAVYYFYPDNRWWGYQIPNVSYSFFSVTLMFVIFCIKFKELNHNKVLSCPQLNAFYLLVICYICVSPIAAYPIIHEEFTTHFIKLAITITLAYKLINSRQDLDWALKGFIFGAWYLSFYAFQRGRNSGDRLEGVGTVDALDSNMAAATLAPVLALCIYYFWFAKSWKGKAIYALAGAFVANGLVLINSRGAFLAGAAGILFVVLNLYRNKIEGKRVRLKILAFIVIGLVGALNIVDDSFIERMSTIKETEVTEDRESAGTRVIFWKAAFDMSLDHPVGKGVNSFQYFGPVYIPYDITVSSNKNLDPVSARRKAVHSSWFEVLSEAGYPGLFLALFMLSSAFYTTNKAKKILSKEDDMTEYFKVVAIQGSLIAFMVAMTFVNRIRADILYWCILFTASSYNIYVLKQQAKSTGNDSSSPFPNKN